MSVATLTVIVTLAAIPVAYAALRTAVLAVRPRPHATARTRAAMIFARATAPALGAAVVAIAVVLPSFVLFEPRHDGERVGPTLLLLAALGAVQVLWIVSRLATMLYASHRVTRAWRMRARPLTPDAWGIPALEIDTGFPVVAVSGFLRPTLYIDARVLAACSPSELAAIAAHEHAHVSGLDNLRRLLLGACAGPRSAAASAWRDAAEEAADERAADTPARAVDLASALVRMARLAPAGSFEATALSTIHDGHALELRIQRLLDGRTTTPGTSSAGLAFITALLIALAAANWMPLLSSTYSLVEAAVKYLP